MLIGEEHPSSFGSSRIEEGRVELPHVLPGTYWAASKGLLTSIDVVGGVQQLQVPAGGLRVLAPADEHLRLLPVGIGSLAAMALRHGTERLTGADGIMTWSGLAEGTYLLEREDGGRTTVDISGGVVELDLRD